MCTSYKYIIILSLLISLSLPVSAQIFLHNSITTDVNGTDDLVAIDIDQDGDIDLLTAELIENRIRWWENDGGLLFSPQLVSSEFSGAKAVSVADLDSDGDLDIIGAAQFDDKISWWENDGEQVFTEHDILTGFDGACAIEVIDFDYDDDQDIVCAATFGDDVVWLENDGDQVFTYHLVAGQFDQAQEICVVDLDQDNDLDIIGASKGWFNDHGIIWWENDGAFNFTSTSLEEDFEGRAVKAADIDNDGDLDIIAVEANEELSDGSVKIWEYESDNTFSSYLLYSDAAENLEISDLNDDHLPDIVTASCYPNSFTHFRNHGGLDFVDRPLAGENLHPRALDFADMDGDGDMDIIGASTSTGWPFFEDGNISWWENLHLHDYYSLVMVPTEENIRIYPEGGEFQFSIELENNGGDILEDGVGVIEVIDPDGVILGPIRAANNITLDPFEILTYNVTQPVPGGLPDGLYTYRARLAYMGGAIYASSEFDFTILPDDDISGDESDIIITSWDSEDEKTYSPSVAIPEYFVCSEAFPNPFNSTTSISVHLPLASQLQVSVFNTLGQKIQEVTNGKYEPGSYRFSFSADDLTSGMYFIQVVVPGKMNEIKKVLLIR